MSAIIDLSSEQLRRAADLKEKISALEQELAAVLESPVAGNGTVANGNAPVANGNAPVEAPAEKKRKKISAAGLARIKAGQKRRWAKFHKETAPAEGVSVWKKKFTMSAEARAKIATAARARWARFHAAKNA